MKCHVYLLLVCQEKAAGNCSPAARSGCVQRLKRPGDVLYAEALDDVAGADVLVVLEGHAAFLADRYFGNFVLEALERLELAFVDDDVVAHQANACAALDLAFRDAATRNLAQDRKSTRLNSSH